MVAAGHQGVMKLRLLALASCAVAAACTTPVQLGEHLGSGSGNQAAGGGNCTGGAGGGSPVMLATSPWPSNLPLEGSTGTLALYGRNLYSLGVAGQIFTVPVSGGTPLTLAAPQNGGHDIAVAPTGVYFASARQVGAGWVDDIMSVPLAGGAMTTIVSGTAAARTLAVDATNVYWTGPGGLVKAPLHGGTTVTLDAAARTPIAVHDGLIYWGQDGSLWSVPVDGGTPSTVWTLSGSDGVGSAEGIAFDSKAAYETFCGASFCYVAKVPLDGGAAVTLATTAPAQHFGSIAVDGANVYYAVHDSTSIGPLPCGALLRVPIEGGTPVTVAAGVPVSSIALDCENVYWSQAPQCADGTKVASGIFKLPKP
jgi:hypothetical protein